jgi:putative membrane protein
MRPESTASGRRLSWISVVVLALVPLLVVGTLLGLARRPADGPVQAAIVNLDEAVTIDGQYIPMGRQLAAEIITSSGDDVQWTLANEEIARDNLASGEYSAVVIIPEGFSAAATSFSANDAAKAKQATIEITVSENSPITDAQFADRVARQAAVALNSTLTETYLDNVFIGLNSVGDQFGTIIDGVKQLADGSGKLADGTRQSADGAAELTDGVGKLADGADQLADGASRLDDGVGELANEAPKLVAGVGELAKGADKLLGGIPGFASGAKQVVKGVGQLEGGASGVRDGLDQVDQVLQGLASGNDTAKGAAQQIGAGVGQAVAGAFQCPEGLDEATCGMLAGVFAQGAMAAADAAALEGFKAGAGAGSQALNTESNGYTLKQAAAGVADGVGQITANAQPIVDNADALGDGAKQLNDGIAKLNSEIGALPDGIDQLADGVSQLADGAGQLAGGVGELSGGAGQLADGLDQLADGAEQLSDGLTTFKAELQKGASDLPSYSEADRAALSEVIAAPVADANPNGAFNTAGTVALLLAIGLWLGAMLSFVAARAVPGDVVSSRSSSARLWAAAVGLPALVTAGQGVILAVAAGVFLRLSFGTTALLALVLAGLAVSFVLANHALVGWLGNVGRGIALVLAAVTVGLAVSSSTGWLSGLAAVSPVHNGFLLARTVVSGGTGLAGLIGAGLLLGVVALAASVTAIASRRKLTAAQFRRRVSG